jgi:hypothetical protein
MTYRRAVLGLALACLAYANQDAFAHGGVVEEEDLCVIKIDYFKGHFKIYQPLTDGHEEYCEDLPNATESVFVMEYLHDAMAEVPIDFRIIRDVTGKGRFARWEDVTEIENLDAVTVFYQEPVVEPDVFTVVHDFEQEGDYIGIVTLGSQDGGKIYRAVFPFEVGFTGLGYWPYIIGLLVIIQFQYLFMSGRITRWWKSRRHKPALSAIFVMLLLSAAGDSSAEAWLSEQQLFEVSFVSSLEPIPINQIHHWELTIVTAAGEAVVGAEITIEGGMPAHDHGLPTWPRVSQELGEGRYRVEGLRFHMAGHWEIYVTIKAQGRTDTVTIPLKL